MMIEGPSYKNKPIGYVRALARALGRSVEELKYLAATAHLMYSVHEVAGSGKTQKITYNPAPLLKEVQRKIIKAMFTSVKYPQYVNGGIKERNYRDDCELHVRAKTVIGLDIATFFESVTRDEVRKIWLRFFSFSPEVAELLTQLTTHEGHLPRGAPTSSYIANLVFWDIEPRVRESLMRQNIRYSRFIDDVSLSSERYLNDQDVNRAISSVYGMFISKGVRPNRKKEQILYVNKGGVYVHDVNVGGSNSKIRKEVRRGIKAEVYNIVRDIRQNGRSSTYLDSMPHIIGTIAWLNQFHPEEAATLRQALASTYDDLELEWYLVAA